MSDSMCSLIYTLDWQNRIKGGQKKGGLPDNMVKERGAPVVSPVYVVEGHEEGQLKVNFS